MRFKSHFFLVFCYTFGAYLLLLHQYKILGYVRTSTKRFIHKVIHNFIRTGATCATGEFPEDTPRV